MGRQRSSSMEDLKIFSSLQSKDEKLNFLKAHPLLRTCSKDKPETLPKVGELVWARVLSSVFWPGFILELKDVECSEEGADGIDDTAYGFVMFLESTYRHAPIAWDQMIPFKDMETQMKLIPYLNKMIVKKSWTPTTLYKTSLEMAKEFSNIPVPDRLSTALSRYEERKKSQKPAKPTPTPVPPPTPPKPELPPEDAINKVMSAVREKKKSGIRVSERITKKQIVKLKPKPQPKSTAAKKTDKTSDNKAATKSPKVNKNKNPRPEVGGEVLKQWTRDRFNRFSKQYAFESSNVQCGECNVEIATDESVKSCHGIPYHVNCLVKHGDDTPVLKCKMCINQQCFLCKVPNEKTHPAYKCSRCELRFHIDCLLKDWPQAEIQGSQGPITCPAHFCHTCLGEQKIYGKFRDYTTSSSRSYKCKLCLSTYHKTCLPAGCGESLQGKEFIICPKHTLPELKVHQRRIGCLGCCKQLKPKEEKVDCSYCIQAFHPECVGYMDEIRDTVSLEVFGRGYKCYSCRWGLFPLYGQVVWFQQPQSQYWPARILFPAEYKLRKEFAKRLPGQYSIEYFGSTSFYDNASRALPLHLTTVEIFKTMKVYQEVPKILRAHEEAAFCFMFSDEYRDKLLAQPKPVYKKIEKNVYRTISVQKVREPTDVCSCSEESTELVCQADSGCTNRDMEMECNDRICKGGSRCCNRMFCERKNDEEFLEQKLFLNKGWGVVAKKAFKPGDFVAEYRGEVIDRNEMKWRLSKKEEEDPMYILEISKEFFIDAEYVGNLSRLINHSCDPNCEVRKYLSMGRSVGGIFARRPIEAGEEVTFRYGCGSQSTAPFRCRCGARNCTVFVGKDVPDNYMIEDDPEQNQDKWEDACSKCGYGGRVICCEFPACGKVWHYHCIGLHRQPGKNWCCSEHPAKKVDQWRKTIEMRKKSKSNRSKITSGKSNSNSSMTNSTSKTVSQHQTKKAKSRQSAPPTQTVLTSDETPTVPATTSRKSEVARVPQKRKRSSTTQSNDEASQPVPKKQRTVSQNKDVSQPIIEKEQTIISSPNDTQVSQSTRKRQRTIAQTSLESSQVAQKNHLTTAADNEDKSQSNQKKQRKSTTESDCILHSPEKQASSSEKDDKPQPSQRKQRSSTTTSDNVSHAAQKKQPTAPANDDKPHFTKRKQRSSATASEILYSPETEPTTAPENDEKSLSITPTPVSDLSQSAQTKQQATDEIALPTQRKRRSRSKSDVQTIKTPEQPSTTSSNQYGRSLRSSRLVTPAKQTTSSSIATTPAVAICDALVMVIPKTLETPSTVPTTKPMVESRRRRAISIPATGITFNVPSTPNTRSKRSRRGESMHERGSVSKKLDTAQILSLHAPSKSEELEDRVVTNQINCEDLDVPRMSRRRSRNHKLAEPFSPLALNPYVRPRELPPVNLSNTLISSDKHVRMGTRSTSSAFSDSTFNNNHINGQSPTSNGLFTETAVITTLAEIKQEPYDNGYEEDSYRLERSLEQTKNKNVRSRLRFDNDSSSVASRSSIEFKSTDTDSDLHIIYENTKPYTRPTRQYSGETFPL